MMLAGQYSLLEHSPETLSLFELCRSRQVSLLMAGVFNSGILAGGSASGAAFHYRPPPPAIIARVKRIEAVADEHGVPLAAAAIQFVLAQPVVASAVLGATRAEEVEANIRGHRQAIPSAFWRALRSAGLVGAGVMLPGDVR